MRVYVASVAVEGSDAGIWDEVAPTGAACWLLAWVLIVALPVCVGIFSLQFPAADSDGRPWIPGASSIAS